MLSKNYAKPVAYTRAGIPADTDVLPLFLKTELQKLELSLQRINLLLPQAADREPDIKLTGMQRYALHATWDPLSSGVDKWVYWTGSAWAAL